VEELEALRDGLIVERDEALASTEVLTQQLGVAAGERDAAREQVRSMEGTKLWRWAAAPRRVYARLRAG
jgi:hypothetical protein